MGSLVNMLGIEVIGTLIDQLAQGLQKWVGWQDKDECCLKGTEGIGKKCECNTGGATCCTSGKPCHECTTCGTSASVAGQKCYLSAYCKTKSTSSSSSSSSNTDGEYYWPTISSDPSKVHLLARIFLGSVCLIWSGLSQLGFLTGKDRWKESSLHSLEAGDNKGLGSFMAAMGYDLDRLNGSGGPDSGKKGEFVWKLLSGQEPSGNNGIQWKEFASVKSKTGGSVAEYYSSIYTTAQGAAKGSSKNTESICKDYPLLVLHILASGYFRAGSAGAKGVTTPPKAATSDPRKPRTIREILYWLSALPYSQGYSELVGRMGEKYPKKEEDPEKTVDQIELYNDSASNASTTLKRDCVTHYLMAACGYCPLVLIGIQGTINTSGTDSDSATPSGSAAGSADQKKCPEHSKDRNKRCNLDEIKKQQEAAKGQQQQQQQQSNGQELQAGQVCYGGYHLEVSKFGPLHGMYANGLFGFDLDGSAAQCLDQLRVYVYHCFYQLYFLRKQCSAVAVLGWQSRRYGKDVYWGSGVERMGGYNERKWICQTDGGTSNNGQEHSKKCGIPSAAGSGTDNNSKLSPLMSFMCDALGSLVCDKTRGSTVKNYPEIETHWTTNYDNPPGHYEGAPKHCPVPMGWEAKDHFKDLKDTHKTDTLTTIPPGPSPGTYPAHCTGRTLALLLEYYCDPVECPSGTLVVLLRLLACITPTDTTIS